MNLLGASCSACNTREGGGVNHWRLQQRGLLRGFQGAQGKGFLGSTPPLELKLGFLALLPRRR